MPDGRWPPLRRYGDGTCGASRTPPPTAVRRRGMRAADTHKGHRSPPLQAGLNPAPAPCGVRRADVGIGRLHGAGRLTGRHLIRPLRGHLPLKGKALVGASSLFPVPWSRDGEPAPYERATAGGGSPPLRRKTQVVAYRGGLGSGRPTQACSLFPVPGTGNPSPTSGPRRAVDDRPCGYAGGR